MATGFQPIPFNWASCLARSNALAPDTYILLDKQGNPQPVLNMPLEEFIEAWKAKQALRSDADEEAPGFTLDECRLIGTLEGTHAELSAELRLTLHTDAPVEVPLGMAGAVLRKLPTPPTARSDGRYLRYDPALGGYLATLVGEPGDEVRIALDLMVPVRRDGTRATLEMLAPRATKGSLVLISPKAIQSVVAGEGVLLSTAPISSGGLKIDAQGVAGEFSLSWVDRPEIADPVGSVLSSSSDVLVSIDGRDVRYSARITVQSFGQAFREFVVRLPRGARYVSRGFDAPFEVDVIGDPASTGEEATAETGQGTELRVTLTSDQSEPVTLDLQAIQPLHGTDNGIHLELSGFEVVGAVPQDGQVGVEVGDGWQLRCEPSDGVRLIDPSQLDFSWAVPEARPPKLAVGLRFVRQPWNLPIEIVPREERLVATPTYELSIDSDEARLRMEVSYRLEGGRSSRTLFLPRFTLEGWEHVSTSTVNVEEVLEVVDQADMLAFESAFATSRRPVVVLEFRHPLRQNDNSPFGLPLPKPDHDGLVLNPSNVFVATETSVQLTPDAARCVGLTPLPIDDASDTAGGRLPGQEFWYRGFYHPLKFAARKQLRPRRLLVTSKSNIDLASDRVMVEQVLAFDVRHQPIGELLLAAPASLKNLELELLPPGRGREDEVGIELDFAAPLDEVASPLLPERAVPLPHQRIGRFRVRARYSLDPVNLAGGNYTVSLISVPGAEFQGHTATLTSTLAESLLPPAGSRWRVESNGNGTSRSVSTVLFVDRQTSFLPLTASGRSPGLDTIEITKEWLQTWIADRTMQTRAVFQFRGAGGECRVELPPGAPQGEDFEVLLDGETTTDWVRVKDKLLITLAGEDSQRTRTLDLRYRTPTSLRWTDTLSPQRPRMVGEHVGTEFMYWELITPVEYLCVAPPPSLVPAWNTGWSKGDWRAKSELATEQIEQWVGARAATLRPTSAEHAFLFRCWPEASLEIPLVRREILVLAVSGSVLAGCLALVYIPGLRRPPVLLLAVVACVAASLMAPQLAAALAPFGFFGLVCALLMWVLTVMYGPRPLSTPTTVHSASARTEPDTHPPSTLVPTGPGGAASTNAPTVSMELTDSNV